MPAHLIDSNVLLDCAIPDPQWLPWSSQALAYAFDHGGLGINPVIYAEVSAGYTTIESLEAVLPADRVQRWPLPWEAAFLAGKVFLTYRREGGLKRSPLPDFFIGAHAAIAGMTLVTRDPRRYRRHFPRVTVIAPDTHFSDLAAQP